MVSKELRRAINAHLFVPMDEEQTDKLHEVATKFLDSTDNDTMSDYVLSFIQNKPNPSFSLRFRERYKEEYGVVVKLPSVVYVIMAAYVVKLALESEELDDVATAQIALIVRNYAVLSKGRWGDLLCPEWMVKMYGYYEKNCVKPLRGSVQYGSLLNAVVRASTWGETGQTIADKDVYDQLRSLCAAGIRGKINVYVGSAAFKNIGSPFSKAYIMASKMVQEWKWKYISISPVERLASALGEMSKKRKKLERIATEVSEELTAEQTYVPAEMSSVLLRRIFDGKSCGIDDCMFTALEFGVYVYYELLLETYSD